MSAYVIYTCLYTKKVWKLFSWITYKYNLKSDELNLPLDPLDPFAPNMSLPLVPPSFLFGPEPFFKNTFFALVARFEAEVDMDEVSRNCRAR